MKMASQQPFHPCGSSAVPLGAFSALHFLRNYNHLIVPQDVNTRYQQLVSQSCVAEEYKRLELRSSPELSPVPPPASNFPLGQTSAFITPHLFGYQPPFFQRESALSPILNRTLSSTSPRRQRGEKKPIPEEQKDDKYFERRRRNNQAAKKSRDARKMREDQIALRATMLEHENAILRAQILTLREEASSLRQMLMAKKTDGSAADHKLTVRTT